MFQAVAGIDGVGARGGQRDAVSQIMAENVFVVPVKINIDPVRMPATATAEVDQYSGGGLLFGGESGFDQHGDIKWIVLSRMHHCQYLPAPPLFFPYSKKKHRGFCSCRIYLYIFPQFL